MKTHYIEVNGSNIYYVDQGKGDPILFLHGIPTSSYVWRNIIPYLSSLGRCIAPDLIGMGKSDKPAIDYTIADHINYMEGLIEALDLHQMTLVLHGWGSIIGFDYAMRHENNCKGLIFYEAYLRSLNKDDISLPYQEQISILKKQEKEFIMKGVEFVDIALSQSMLHSLTPEEISFYREPFGTAGTGKPLYQYLQELPCGNGKTSVDQLIAAYSKKLMQSPLPKLMLYSIPGFITTMATAIWAKEKLPHLEVVEIGEELHYAQESNPLQMGETMSIWLQGVEQMRQV